MEKIHSRIKTLKKNRKLEEKYMTIEEMIKIEYSKGKREGKAETLNDILTLVSKMYSDGMSDDIPRLSTDEEFLKEMLQKYQL